MQREKRVHPRAVIRLPCRIRPAGAEDWTDAMLHDLSSGGAGLLAKFPLALQSELQLQFSLADGSDQEGVFVSGLVMRTSTPPGDYPGFRHFLGVHFLDLRGAAFERVRVFVWNTLHPGTS